MTDSAIHGSCDQGEPLGRDIVVEPHQYGAAARVFSRLDCDAIKNEYIARLGAATLSHIRLGQATQCTRFNDGGMVLVGANDNARLAETTIQALILWGSAARLEIRNANRLNVTGCSLTDPRSVYQNMSLSATAVSLRNVTNSSATGLIIPETLGAAAGLKVEMSHNITIENPHIVLSTTWTDRCALPEWLDIGLQA